MSLQEILNKRPEDILLPNESVENDALRGLKEALDSVAPNFSPLESIHVDGLKVDQVWVQAQMILDGVSEKLATQLEKFQPATTGYSDEELDEDLNDSELSSDENIGIEDESSEFFDGFEKKPLHELQDDYMDSDEDEQAGDQEESSALKGEEEEEGSEADEDSEDEETEAGQAPSKNPEGLDADFDLAEFQQHVLELEKNGDMEADDEHVDYFAELEDPSDDADMHFEDFFGPPPKRSKKSKQVKFAENNTSDPELGTEDVVGDEAGLEDAMETTRKDLFDDEEDDEDDSKSEERLSRFERQQQELMRQIEQLESENIGEKQWGMKGEAQAKDRPQEEESLFNVQFERNMKSAPVITEESTLSIEDMIKERIRKQKFDDIPRRSEALAPVAKPDLPELSDAKSQKSLAEQYEEDQMRQQNPEYFAKQDTAAMDAAHREVVDLFKSVSRRLDALCSWQYRPKDAAPSLTVVSDTPSIAMEEAQPGTLSGESQLAPQEIYKSASAVPMVNEEMTTSLKRKKRRDKAKAKAQKSSGTASQASAPSKRGGKEEIYSTLKRGNVTMVDKRGQKRDMRGQEVKDKAPLSAAQIKL